MFLVKNREEKKRGEKWRISDIFTDLQRPLSPLTSGIKGQWKFSALLNDFVVVLLCEGLFYFFLWYIKDKCPSDYNCGLKMM